MKNLKQTSFRINKDLLASAKEYAELKHTTISQLLRDYFVGVQQKLIIIKKRN